MQPRSPRLAGTLAGLSRGVEGCCIGKVCCLWFQSPQTAMILGARVGVGSPEEMPVIDLFLSIPVHAEWLSTREV